MQNCSQFDRTAALLGADNIKRLRSARVCVFGIGGVGGHLAEALVRCGVGALTLVDGDNVELTNLNRQLVALHSTLSEPKVQVAKDRFSDIDPLCNIVAVNAFFGENNAGIIDFSQFDYVADAVDDVPAKLLICRLAKEAGVPVISCMGTGNKLDPMAFRIADISKTRVCPLARVMRRELRKLGIEHLKCVYSEEVPHTNASVDGRIVPSSVPFVPSAAGLLMAKAIICDLIDISLR